MFLIDFNNELCRFGKDLLTSGRQFLEFQNHAVYYTVCYTAIHII